MSQLKLEVKGIEELQKKFAALQLDVATVAAGALVASGFVVSNKAKELCPWVTHNLARSIFPGRKGTITDQTAELLPRQGTSNLAKKFTADGVAEMLVGTNVIYGPRIEFGFKGPDILGRKFNQKAQPYLRPALEEKRDEVKATFQGAFQKVVEMADRVGTRYSAVGRLEEYAGE